MDAPEKVAETYLSRQGRWKLPLLAGVINTPFLRRRRLDLRDRRLRS